MLEIQTLNVVKSCTMGKNVFSNRSGTQTIKYFLHMAYFSLSFKRILSIWTMKHYVITYVSLFVLFQSTVAMLTHVSCLIHVYKIYHIVYV